jgi:hypothetical protein
MGPNGVKIIGERIGGRLVRRELGMRAEGVHRAAVRSSYKIEPESNPRKPRERLPADM